MGVSDVWVRVTETQPVPMTVKRDSTPWTPYQKRSGWVASSEAGLEVSQ